MKRSKTRSICVKCFLDGRKHWNVGLEKHHIYPISSYGKSGNNKTLLLCHKCHKQIDSIVVGKGMTQRQLRDITRAWLSGVDVMVK